MDDLQSAAETTSQSGVLHRFEELVDSNPVYKNIVKTGETSDSGDEIVDQDELDETDGSTPVDIPEVLLNSVHDCIKIGCTSIIRHLPNGDDILNVTALHIAAEYGSYEDMQIILKAGAQVKDDGKGLTPLHLAALSTEPNPMTARLLIKYMKRQTKENTEQRYSLINARTSSSGEESTNGNTALHLAAGNEHVSREFIQALEVIDPSIKNEKEETAFHVAARAANPDVIVSMLETFTPYQTGWKMKDIEESEGIEGKTLLESCSRRGNAKAVGLLINYGGDISKKILFDLVEESVNNPAQTNNLISVYRVIIDKCVFWKWLKSSTKERQDYPRRDAKKEYGEKQREIMLELLNSKNDKDNNVLEHAIITGAEVFLREIVNTPNVAKITSENKSDEVKYDVTNFLFTPGRSQELHCRCSLRRRVSPQSDIDPESQPSTGELPAPKEPYLYLITDRTEDFWKHTDILQVEPFQTLTQPICATLKLFYLAMTLLQLFCMICFSFYFMQPYCSLGDVLNLNLSDFNSSVQCKSTEVWSVYQRFFWLLWPVAIFSVLLLDVKENLVWRCLQTLLSTSFWFLVIMILWVIASFVDGIFFLSCTSLFHLFGWLTTLSLFVRSSENVCVFLFLLKEIIIKDILFSFGIVFVFIIVSFSSAVHVLRKSALTGDKIYFDTFYNLFLSALTTGDFVSETFDDDDKNSFISLQFRATFAIYLCCATIVMLNILISTINNRYEETKKAAKNVWQFHTVKLGMCVMFMFHFSLSRIVCIFNFYWRKMPECLKHFTGAVINPNYDQVLLEKQKDRIFLSIKYSKRKINWSCNKLSA